MKRSYSAEKKICICLEAVNNFASTGKFSIILLARMFVSQPPQDLKKSVIPLFFCGAADYLMRKEAESIIKYYCAHLHVSVQNFLYGLA